MPNLELAGWVAVVVAATAFVALVAVEGWRHVHRAYNLSRLLATSRAEQSPVPHRDEASHGSGAGIPRSAALPSLPHRPPVAPSGSVADGRK